MTTTLYSAICIYPWTGYIVGWGCGLFETTDPLSHNTDRSSWAAKIVLLSHQGNTDSAIARKSGIDRQKVSRTINRVLAIGVREGLKDLPGRE